MKNLCRAFPKLTYGFVAMCLVFASCEKPTDSNNNNNNNNTNTEGQVYQTGWLSDDENIDEIPADINLVQFSNATIPSSIDLTSKFPPVGDQGAYGTCVAWTVGYNLKTAIEGMDKGLTPSQLAQSSNQFSPKDLYLSIPSHQKADCDGTIFEFAFDQMIARGIATMATAPYSGLGTCNSGTSSSADNEATNFKIQSYRRIDVNIETIKSYLAQNRPVAIGAELADNFMTWNSDDILSSHSSFANVGQHARHAFVLVGYDDNKGPNGAFIGINSWGDTWGNDGKVWIDYNFCVNDFIFDGNAFVASNQPSNFDPENNTTPVVTGNPDLVPWNISDDLHPDAVWGNERVVYYNVYNVGDQTASASEKWNISYMYYNAFDATDFGFILFDYYTNEFGSYGENGPLDTGYGISGNWWNHIDVESGGSVAGVFGVDNIPWTYTMPDVTGYYYLVMIADAFEDMTEVNEANNMFFLTDAFGFPPYFENGVISGFGKNGKMTLKKVPTEAAPTRNAMSQSPTARNAENVNAYTPQEIQTMLRHHRETGKLNEKLREFQANEQQGKQID